MRPHPHGPGLTLKLLIAALALSLAPFIAPGAGAVSLDALFAPKADLWERWTRHDPQSAQIVDHRDWGEFLTRSVVVGDDGINRVAYGDVTAGDRAALGTYIDRLAALPVSTLNRDEQLAFWVNLYNALTVQVVLDHFPVDTILDIDISPGFFADGPWGKTLVTVEGHEVSLNDIEHRILRPIWRDPRIHYAVNCASIGCPNLIAHPFTGSGAPALLDEGARSYINHPRGVSAGPDGLVLSKIYSWFEEDFGRDEEDVIAHIRRFADLALAESLALNDEISDYRYDWSLNGTSLP